MKLIKAQVSNFGSYDYLQIEFNNAGLTLVHGSTGAGKSTLLDIPTWCLYGHTSKQGGVDDIRSWSVSDAPTEGSITVQLQQGKEIQIKRSRGSQKQNDLLFIEDGVEHRGKDILETQKLLNARLGVTEELYLHAAYFSEFSPSSLFFISGARERRELFEHITDLSFSASLLEGSSEAIKVNKKSLKDIDINISNLEGKLHGFLQNKKAVYKDLDTWQERTKEKVLMLQAKFGAFEAEKVQKISALELKRDVWEKTHTEKLESLHDQINRDKKKLEGTKDPVCKECGRKDLIKEREFTKLESKIDEIERLVKEINPYLIEIENHTALVNNPYQEQLLELKKYKNPFQEQLNRLEKQCTALSQELDTAKTTKTALEYRTLCLTQLKDLSSQLRGILLTNSISEIESQTNIYLEKYFNSEFRVVFNLNDADNLDVEIMKNGYQCTYKQLSKGQRGLLKLVFSVAVMSRAANNSGVHFDTLFFDESLDGLDSELKVKAYGLFEELSTRHENVMVIDHSTELKSMFSRQYKVSLVGDNSKIEVTD